MKQLGLNYNIKKVAQWLFDYQSIIYKVFLYVLACVIIVYLFPKQSQFKFNFRKGQLWQHETLYAPFDFAILKSKEELLDEQRQLKADLPTYFSYDSSIVTKVKQRYIQNFKMYFAFPVNSEKYKKSFQIGIDLIEEIYNSGVLPLNYSHEGGNRVSFIENNIETESDYDRLIQLKKLSEYLDKKTGNIGFERYKNEYYKLLFDIIEPNLTYDKRFNNQLLTQAYSKISTSRDIIPINSVVIAKGELIGEINFQKLDSLKEQYDSYLYSKYSVFWIVLGHTLLVGLVLLMLYMFIYKYRPVIFENNTKLTFIFCNVILVVGFTVITLNFDSTYLYAVPICILPFLLKAFFDARLGLFVHVLTVLLLGFIVPNSFEYVFLQIMVGIVTILSTSELYKRANLFISVGQVIFIYLLGYFAFNIVHEGTIYGISLLTIGLFALNGVLTLFVQPLIYLFEKLFNLVSDVSLLELSDTNSKFFKEFSDKAPGTFYHSLQVANLAESAANAIDANALLTRVGALYHDIGKIDNPMYFIENQKEHISPHNEITPLESARIIINHVIKGVEIAQKNKLPDRIIDFIRTHHGTSIVYFFYKKYEEIHGKANIENFSYPGPKPFSKETAILMMADSVEATSKSIKEPTVESLKESVNKIVNQQMSTNQFINCNITLSEIEVVKKIFIDKLINIYHLRIEYPE